MRTLPLAALSSLILFSASGCDLGSEPGVVAEVEVVLGSETIDIGEQIQGEVIARDGSGDNVDPHLVTWSSSNPDVAAVDSTGRVTGRTEGSARIVAVVDGVGGIATVKVFALPAALELLPVRLEQNESVELRKITFLRSSNGELLIDRPLEWSVADHQVASIGYGDVLKGAVPGRTVVTARSGDLVTTAEVEVVPAPVREVALYPREANVPLGFHRWLEPHMTDSRHMKIDTRGRSFTWETSDESIVEIVDTTGFARGVREGVATVTATIDGVSATSRVRVLAYPETPTFEFVAAGHLQTCAISSSQRLYCWGYNQSGSLASEWPTELYAGGAVMGMPAPVLSDFRFTMVSVGNRTTCAMTTDQRILCWGADASPTTTEAPTDLVSLEVGFNRVCGLNSEGQAFCGPAGIAMVPVPTDLRFTTITVGSHHTCGLVEGGKAYCWGQNNWWQLGVDGGETTEPVAVSLNQSFRILEAGSLETCGVVADGRTYCWGWDYGEQFVVIPGAPAFTQIDMDGESAHACGLIASGAAYCWGSNGAGELGFGPLASEVMTPGAVSGDLHFTEIDVGGGTTCGLVGQLLYCWGNNGYGQVAYPQFRGDVRTPYLLPYQAGAAN